MGGKHPPIDFARPMKMGLFIEGTLHLSAAEACELAGKGAAIVDTREAYETNFRVFDVPLVIYLEKSRFAASLKELPRDLPLIVADNVGAWSKEAVRILKDAGYANVAHLSGGMIDWDRSGLPVRKDKDYQLSGQCSCKLKPRVGGNPLKRRAENPLTRPSKAKDRKGSAKKIRQSQSNK